MSHLARPPDIRVPLWERILLGSSDPVAGAPAQVGGPFGDGRIRQNEVLDALRSGGYPRVSASSMAFRHPRSLAAGRLFSVPVPVRRH